MLADFDGVVIIPAEIADDVITEVEAVIGAEDNVRNAIISGGIRLKPIKNTANSDYPCQGNSINAINPVS